MSLPALKADSPRLPAPYLSVDTAAVLLRCTPRYIRLRCDEIWAATGQAKKFGNIWGVHPRADRRLRTNSQQAREDLEVIAELEGERVRPQYIKLGKAKRDILRGFAEFRSNANSAEEHRKQYEVHVRASGDLKAAGIKLFSGRTLQRWETDYKQHGFRGLVRKERSDCTESINGEAAIEFIIDLILGDNGLKLRYVISVAKGRALEHKNDPTWQLGSYNSIRQVVNARIPKGLRLMADKGPRAAEEKCVPKRPRDYEAIPSNSEWVGDERTLDVWCRALIGEKWKAIRPKITSWNDMRSRMVVGWILAPFADSSTILGSLRNGCGDFGLPNILRTDWGADYKAVMNSPETMRWKNRRFDKDHIKTVTQELEIEVQPTLRPYQPWVKPIERFYGTMKDQFDRLQAAFWGGCPSERPEGRDKYIRENLEKLMTLEECESHLKAFFDDYHRTPHSAADMFGKSPLQAMEAFRDGAAVMRSEEALDHLFRIYIGPRMVRRDGIKVDGHWYGHGDMQLVSILGEKVLLGFQPHDASKTLVCRLDKRPLFEIECPSLIGFNRREAKAMYKTRKAILRPWSKRVKRASKIVGAIEPAEMTALHRAGVAAEHGSGEPSETTAPRLVVDPALEQAIAKAPRVKRASRAVRTGTDDDVITVDDLLRPDIDDEPETEPVVEKYDFYGLDDPGGDDV